MNGHYNRVTSTSSLITVYYHAGIFLFLHFKTVILSNFYSLMQVICQLVLHARNCFVFQVAAVQNQEFGMGGTWGLFEHSEGVRGLVMIDLEIQ